MTALYGGMAGGAACTRCFLRRNINGGSLANNGVSPLTSKLKRMCDQSVMA